MSDTRELTNGVFAIHDYDQCEGAVCPFHKPTHHHMVTWPMTLRRGGLIERQCKHGCGHPDPDSLMHVDPLGGRCLDVHGCDGCCRKVTGREREGE